MSALATTKPLTARQRDLLRRGLAALLREALADRPAWSEAQVSALHAELRELEALL